MRFIRVGLFAGIMIFVVAYCGGYIGGDDQPATVATVRQSDEGVAVGDTFMVATGEQPVAVVRLTVTSMDGDRLRLADAEGDAMWINASQIGDLEALLIASVNEDDVLAWRHSRYGTEGWLGPADGDYVTHVCVNYGVCDLVPKPQRVTNYVPQGWPGIVRDILQYPVTAQAHRLSEQYLH